MIVMKEMEWVIETFRYMGGIWKVRGEKWGMTNQGTELMLQERQIDGMGGQR